MRIPKIARTGSTFICQNEIVSFATYEQGYRRHLPFAFPSVPTLLLDTHLPDYLTISTYLQYGVCAVTHVRKMSNLSVLKGVVQPSENYFFWTDGRNARYRTDGEFRMAVCSILILVQGKKR